LSADFPKGFATREQGWRPLVLLRSGLPALLSRIQLPNPRINLEDSMTRRFSILLLLAIVAATYLYTATSRAIVDDGDALYAHIGQRMAETGDWVTPYANGVRFLDKPPMMFWLMAATYKVFGVSEFAARFPSALAVLGTALLLFFLGARAACNNAGFVAGSAVAMCIGTFLFTRMAFPDVFFVFFLTLSLYAFLEWYVEERNRVAHALLFYIATACAVLSKGLIGVAFPAAIVVIFLVWEKNLSRLWRFHIWKGLLVFLAVSLPWHIMAAHRNPGFLWYYFVNEQVYRFLGKRLPLDYESISLPIFWALVLVWLFPWSAFLPAIRHGMFHSDSEQKRASCTVRICASWALVLLVFFSFSSRIEHYAMPIFPPLALLIGLALSGRSSFDSASDERRQRSVVRGFAFNGILGAFLAVIFISAGMWLSGWGSGETLSRTAAARLHAYKYYFAPLFDMPPDVINGLRTPFLGTCAALAAGLIGGWWIHRRNYHMTAVVLLNLTMAGFCLFAFRSLGICEDVLSSRQFGRKLNQMYRPGDYAVLLGDYETANSINFYSPLILHVYEGTAALLQWGLRYPDAPELLLSRAELDKQWNGPQRTFLLGPEDKVQALDLRPERIVMRSAGRILVCNQ
jgi:4-amino-4-deoxy-L-arabinose transferase-like glycosyltransferase